ncbi:MAG: DUF2116 family Zn-ribbon domain-containing protein [Campylobacterales bacterium]|nr:DUF2116 family Zn-ribbon domain-containing protein [Campylobacterales bacterium]NQY52322.1 DUF2116 family Zn-ribbon domain-containing protein [Campylobacteraceae bacterium]
MSHCPFCNKKIAMSKAFCSKHCKENYFQLIAIQIPKLFIKNIFIFCTAEQKDAKIEEFANRHGWRIDLVKDKINNLAAEYGYVHDDEISNYFMVRLYYFCNESQRKDEIKFFAKRHNLDLKELELKIDKLAEKRGYKNKNESLTEKYKKMRS